MDLKQFVSETISQIVDGIIDADSRIAQSGGAVNPSNTVTNKAGDGPYGYYAGNKDKRYRPVVQEIQFDVVLNAAEGSETKGGIGIHVGAIALGSAGKSDAETSSQSRVKFSVPLLLPNSKNEINSDIG